MQVTQNLHPNAATPRMHRCRRKHRLARAAAWPTVAVIHRGMRGTVRKGIGTVGHLASRDSLKEYVYDVNTVRSKHTATLRE